MSHTIEPNTIYHCGISGGKDSTALLLWAIYESGIPHSQIVASFCDTQNEADCTYDHVRMLAEKVFPIIWIETEGFFQLAKRKKRFPSAKARFCTQELKLKPTKAFIESLFKWDESIDSPKLLIDVIGLSGIRRGESLERAKLLEWGSPLESYFHIREWRPLIDWGLADVLAIHERHGVPLNPLYSKGAKRVGCFPCVMSSKQEIRAMSRHYPERIDTLREQEAVIGSTFFAPNMIPDRFKTRTWTGKTGRTIKICTIDDVVRWSQTGKGAVGLPCDEDLFAEQAKDLPPQICLAQHLACE